MMSIKLNCLTPILLLLVPLTMPQCVSTVSDDCTLDYVNFTKSYVLSAIKRLKANLSCGPDGSPPLLFKTLALMLQLL